ncbi:MAG: nucleoside 2-deoxyribosyltransferase [SAR324 cluster bacterium]|nr:nucleoside 2-deoxyribosyltransferase [SAR324 cluster bacterium]
MPQKTMIYCSGPLFSPEEIASMTAISRILEQHGYDTFLPHRDGFEPYVLPKLGKALGLLPEAVSSAIDQAIFALDVYQIVERCDVLVFNMNGRVPDEGGAVEAGIAFACGKPVVLFKQDYRTVFHGRDNSMITGLSHKPPVSDLQRLPELIRALPENRPTSTPQLSSTLMKTVQTGKKLWTIRSKLTPKQNLHDRELMDEILKICEEK